MKIKIQTTNNPEPSFVYAQVSSEVAKKYTQMKKSNPDLSDFGALKKAKQIVEGVTILSKDEAWGIFQKKLKQKEIETGKSQMEIFREMEFSLSQKDEDSLTVTERTMLQALRDVEQKFYGNS